MLNYVINRRNKLKLKVKDLTLTKDGKKPKLYSTIKVTHTFRQEAAVKIFKVAFQQFSKKENYQDTEKCINEIFAKSPLSEQNHKLWYKLAERLYSNKTPLKPVWLKDYAKTNQINGCNNIIGKGLLNNDEINAAGLQNLTNNLREYIDKIIKEMGGKSSSRMKKFITSSVSTYRKDPLVSKRVFEKLNLKGIKRKIKKI